jgi:gliding motility-associated-like protein
MFRNRYYIITLFCLAFAIQAKATHNRAGEITYKWLFGYTYEIKVTTYTNIGSSGLADRCVDTVYFGDGQRAFVPRSNGTNTICGSDGRDGIPISSNIKLNEYVTTHTYPGPGNYVISMQDPNRNAGVLNMSNSVNEVFYIESLLVIPTFGSGKNNSAVLTFPPIDKGCLGRCFRHNPGAYDIDGDSLSYELTYCRKGPGGASCLNYTYPATGGGVYDVNATSGTLTWCSPQLQGEYNLAMFIKEWRKNDDGDYFLVGYILRDLQVDVGTCVNNSPSIQVITDTCILAGTLLTRTVTATDPDGDQLTLSANGGPFGVTPPVATFAAPVGASPAHGVFSWQTSCEHIRKTPYQVTIKVEDQDPQINLVDFKTFNITIVAPPPLNLTATPLGTNVQLNWNLPTCQLTTGSNKIIYYTVYRKSDCLPWVHSPCETGVPAYTGFVRVGYTTGMNDTQFLDTNAGNGLSQGTNYSYLVVAVYTDGSQSYASNQVCVQLKRDVPILMNVDVTSTDATTGSIDIKWIKPVLGVNALDTVAVPGPYEFRLMYHSGFPAANFTQVYSVSSQYFAGLNQGPDTSFSHIGTSPSPLNTQTIAHTYKIEFYANGQFVGAGQKASSVFLTLVPGDNQMTLTWSEQVPWTNSTTEIYEKAPSSAGYVLIGSTTQHQYTATGLTNGALYCYKVKTSGAYSDPTISSPLLNYSQEVCDRARDMTPPCAPTLEIVSDCQVPSLMLQWNNPNHSCSDDAVKYNIYISDTEDSDLVLSDSLKNMNDTLLVFDDLTSIAGCYAITAVDSFGNESAQSQKICVDNCPEYELPNVITINGDGVNDFFKPIKNKFIKDIDLKIYNRWGTLVFESTDPKINWDGKVIQSKLQATEGTYFYVCQVNEIRVTGIKERYLKGFIQIFNK